MTEDHKDDTRLKQYTEIEKRQQPEGSHPAAAALHRRPETPDSGRRIAEFARIQRGRET
ncbi:hypothetical protein [Falsirhodobacter deserti]|uniref:hypothetical protein n=1 Tax=Falsirhodobacter deserti TaxID=1365611 RepID=UPI0013E3BFCA|nr:hypothetical protein [Falsirhodobacter deserti]